MGVMEGEKLGAKADASSRAHLCIILLVGSHILEEPSSQWGIRCHTSTSAYKLAILGWRDGGEPGFYGMDVGTGESKSVFWPGRISKHQKPGKR